MSYNNNINNNNNNNNKECKHNILSIKDRSCTVCGMSRYDQLRNKEERLTKKEEKELEECINQKHWGLID
jgi:ribosomal protein L37E